MVETKVGAPEQREGAKLLKEQKVQVQILGKEKW